MKVRATIEFDDGVYLSNKAPELDSKGAFIHVERPDEKVVEYPLYIDGVRVGTSIGLPHIRMEELRVVDGLRERVPLETSINCEIELPLFDGFDGLMHAARELLDRVYPEGTVVADKDSPDPGPRLAAGLRDCLEALNRG